MIGRVRQFFRAMTARVSAADRAYVRSVLPREAQSLFFAMHRVDQRHALNVTRTAMTLVDALDSQERMHVDRALLERCALLHDVGRKKGDLDIFGKVACVLLAHYLPAQSKKWAEDGTSHMLDVYYHHPAIGAALLRAIGLTREAELIAHHHESEAPDDSIELRLLRLADEAN